MLVMAVDGADIDGVLEVTEKRFSHGATEKRRTNGGCHTTVANESDTEVGPRSARQGSSVTPITNTRANS